MTPESLPPAIPFSISEWKSRLRAALNSTSALDNLLNRDYYETQNYFESRVTPDARIIARIHGTPGFPLTAVTGVTLRFASRR